MPMLIVEWARVTWPDVLPRLRAGQLPALAALGASGRTGKIPAGDATRWDAPSALARFAAAGLPASLHGWSPEDVTSGESDESAELDPRLFQLFPACDQARPRLESAFVALYACHNAAIASLLAPGAAGVVAVRYDFVARVSDAYAHSSALPFARAAAFRLLDLLLHDLHQEAGPDSPLVLFARGNDEQPGFRVKAHPTRLQRGSDASGVAIPTSLDEAIDCSLNSDTTLVRTREDVPSAVEGWRLPQIAPLRPVPVATAAAGAESAGESHVRRGRAEDRPRLAWLFPQIAWPAEATSFLHFSDRTEQRLNGAVALDSHGGVSFGLLAGGEAGAHALVATLIEEARARGMASLASRNEIPLGDPRQHVMEAAGSRVGATVTLWRVEVEAMRRRAPAAAIPDGWRLRPATAADLATWESRPEARELLGASVSFDADLSCAAERHGRPAGLLLIQRLDGLACANLLAVAGEARAAGGFVRLLAFATEALRAGGIREIIFTTDDTRREMIAIARRCGGKELRRSVRLFLRFTSSGEPHGN